MNKLSIFSIMYRASVGALAFFTDITSLPILDENIPEEYQSNVEIVLSVTIFLIFIGLETAVIKTNFSNKNKADLYKALYDVEHLQALNQST